ncbi:hypothetical protein QPK87_06370 [Kamptonema cortianum]|nr:hypothetical protein [Geitlerinema splendidum]MDK3156198.1 hypothetical protein [Kamptonema cortianum]
MAKATQTLDLNARDYADRLVLEKLTEIYEAVKPSEVSELLQDQGLNLSAVRALLASNPSRFAYDERRWVPAARIAASGRSIAASVKEMVERFGAPMPFKLAVVELSRVNDQHEDDVEAVLRRVVEADPDMILTGDDKIAAGSVVFRATYETPERAFLVNGIEASEVEAVQKQLGKFDWHAPDAVVTALEKTAPVSIKALGAAAWLALNPQDPKATHHYCWRTFNAELLSIPGFVASGDGRLFAESEAKSWVTAAVKGADKLDAVIEVEDAAPLELKKADIEECVKAILSSEESVTATSLLENKFEVTPMVKTFPDDLANVMESLNNDNRVWWVGGDRFRKPGTAPDFVNETPEPLKYVQTEFKDEEGEYVDSELTDEGLSSSLRKLLLHPLATDVMDEDIQPAPKAMPEQLRLVLKPIHRELGTFPMCQFPTGWFGEEPNLQELIFVDSSGNELQVWLNHECRLLFNLFDWWLEQPVESGSVFQLTKTKKANVFEFEWLEQSDPVVYISNQRMEELREIASNADGKSTFELLREVMVHWPKGADFLTVLWELNVVRRTSRRMLASLLSSYVCFYQRSGSPVWHYDHKKVEQGFDKTKRKFIKKD